MTPVGATPLPPPHGSSAAGRRAPSVGATPLSAVAVRLDGRFTGALGPPPESASATRACEEGDAGGREAVHRAAADVWVQGAPGAGARALGANPLDALEWETFDKVDRAAEGSVAGKGARGGAAGAALLREAREAQAAAVAALPLHAVALAERYGGLAGPISPVCSPPPPSLPYKVDTSRPSLRTNWTRLVHPSVLIGHVSSIPPY